MRRSLTLPCARCEGRFDVPQPTADKGRLEAPDPREEGPAALHSRKESQGSLNGVLPGFAGPLIQREAEHPTAECGTRHTGGTFFPIDPPDRKPAQERLEHLVKLPP
jgi:hypothetical protein